VDPHKQILVRVRTPEPSKDRRHLSQLKRLTPTGLYKELLKQVAIVSLKIFFEPHIIVCEFYCLLRTTCIIIMNQIFVQ
jgi:hypothetical protein